MNLTNTQKTILEAAAARPDGAINPLPEQIKGGAALKVITALENKGLIHDTSLNPPYRDWRISEEGYRAIGQEPPQEPVEEVNHDDLFEESDEELWGIPRDAPEEIAFIVKSHFAPETTQELWPSLRDALQEAFRRGRESLPPTRAKASKPRDNTKQARMIDMMKRPEGATVEQISKETGWNFNTIRGAIAGTLKKRLGLNITTERLRNVGPEARGGYTIYRIEE